MKSLRRLIFRIFLIFEHPLTLVSIKWIKNVRTRPMSKAVFMKQGILPISDHYYQPMINPMRDLRHSLRIDRKLNGVDMNDNGQLELLSKMIYGEELLSIPWNSDSIDQYFYNNDYYRAGDADYLYGVIRYFKPRKILEIGSGMSTLLSLRAIKKNMEENRHDFCSITCIEPYEHTWLESAGVSVIRDKVECLDESVFETLERNDILFIDSSHIIRPQGDVLFEYLQILPLLNAGVLVHIHDIFTPKDYLDKWVLENHCLWNEQYLLEAFLTGNSSYRIIGALNYLSHHYREEFSTACPIYSAHRTEEPGAFWMVKQ